MLVIRLSRTGRKKQAYFRLVAADKKRTPTGRIVARLGHYNPHTKELVVNKDELKRYIDNGAQPSSTVVKLLQREKIKLPEWAEANLIIRKRAPKPKKTEVARPDQASTAASTADKPAEEAPAAETEAQTQQPVTPEAASTPEPVDESSTVAKPDSSPEPETKPTAEAKTETSEPVSTEAKPEPDKA